MIGLIQRVSSAQVAVADKKIASINKGLLALIGIEKSDSQAQADRLLQRLLNYRVFADHDGRMNLSLCDVEGGLLLVPQFTLAADTRKGLRPSFASAASPTQAGELFAYLVGKARQEYATVASGEFAADMQVSLVNDGPVTFELRS